MDIFPPVPTSIAHVGHLEASIVIPSEINSNMKIFSTELPLMGHGDPSDESNLLEPHIESVLLSNEPQVDFKSVSLSEVPPWKRGTNFQAIKSTIQEPNVQRVIVEDENKRSINIFPTDALLIENLNVSEPCANSKSIPIESKNCNEMLSIETVAVVNDLFQHSNAAEVPNVETDHSDELTIPKVEPSSEYDDDDEDEISNIPNNIITTVADSQSSVCDINKSDVANVIQNKETSDRKDNDDKSNINLPAEFHSTEDKDCDMIYVKHIGSKPTEDDDYNDDEDNDSDEETKVFVNAADISNVDCKVKKKEETITNMSAESEESNSESINQNSIDEDVDNEVEDPASAVQEIETPNRRTKKNEYFTCETCGKTFDREHRLHRHMNLHKKERRPFECEYCRRRFTQEAHLQRHFITHEKKFLVIKESQHNIDGYQCSECPRKFLKQESLASHMKTHRKKIDPSKRFKCELCPKVFESLYILTRHKKQHEGNRKYSCQICGKMFGLASHLVDHLNIHSGAKPHVCDYCQKSFQQACTLKDHLRTHTGEQPYLCSECGKTFNNASNLRQHQLRHSGIKRYQCPECPSKFTCKSGLFSHKSTHRDQKPFACVTCGSSFTKNYSLKKHERIHTGEKPYKCDYCEMRFNSADHMKRHMRTHTGEKPYKCKYCEKKFAQSNDMTKHLRSHVGENVYKCEECDASFRLNTELKKHISEHYQAQIKDKTNKTVLKN